MSDRFSKAVLLRHPELGRVDWIFCFMPVRAVLCGVAYEPIGDHAYAGSVLLPMYVRQPHLHQGFGGRLPYPTGFIERAGLSPREQADVFLERVSPIFSTLRGLEEPEKLAEYIESRDPRILENPRFLFPYAMTLLRVGRVVEAREHLRSLAADPWVRDFDPAGTSPRKQFAGQIDEAIDALDQGTGAVDRLMAQWDSENRAQYRL